MIYDAAASDGRCFENYIRHDSMECLVQPTPLMLGPPEAYKPSLNAPAAVRGHGIYHPDGQGHSGPAVCRPTKTFSPLPPMHSLLSKQIKSAFTVQLL